jgi:hypothetical protein
VARGENRCAHVGEATVANEGGLLVEPHVGRSLVDRKPAVRERS